MADRSVSVILRAIVGPYQAAMARATASTAGLNTQVGALHANTGRVTGGLGRTAGSLGAVRQQASGLGSELGLVNPKLLGGAGLAYGLKSTADAAIGWESAFAGVRKTVTGTEQELQGLADGLRRMSTEIPTSANDLAAIAESAGQLGIETANVEAFTRVIADLGETTNLAGQEGATQLARFANITQMSQQDFDRLGSTVVALGNNFATTEAEIVQMGLRIAGAGAQVGMTEADILALSTALSSVGIEAEAGGSAISRVMMDLASQVETGGDKLADFAAVAGMSATDFATAWRDDAAGALGAFITGLGRMDEQGGSTLQTLEELGITEIRMRDALLRSAGAMDLVTEANELGNAAWEENNALQLEAAQRYGTTEAKMQMARNAITDLRVELGERLLPAIGDVSAGLTDLLRFEIPGTSDGGPSNMNVGGLLAEGLVTGIGSSFGLSGLFGTQAREEEIQAAAAAASAHTDAEKSMRLQIEALDDLEPAADGASDAIDEHARAQDRAAAATAEARRQFREQTLDLQAQTDPLFAAIRATGDYQDALAALDAVRGDAEASAEDLAAAERKVYEAAFDVAYALANLTDENGQLVYSTDELVRVLSTIGVPPDVIQRLLSDIRTVRGELDDLAGTDPTVMVHVRVDRSELDALRAELGNVATGRPGEGGRTVGTGTPTQDVSASSPTAHHSQIPRNHMGGRITGGLGWFPGLDPDERLRVLKVGEGVTPVYRAADTLAGAGSSGTSIGRQVTVAEGAIRVVAADAASAGAEAVWELRGLAREMA